MIIDIFLPLSLVFIMFTLGLGLTTKDFVKVVEFGGGYGSMCRLFRNMNYLNKYIIFVFKLKILILVIW